MKTSTELYSTLDSADIVKEIVPLRISMSCLVYVMLYEEIGVLV